MLTIERIGMKNFLSIGNVFSRYELNKHKTTLICGRNGAGKSTLIDGLCFGLYGKSFRKINKPTLANMINKKDCVVEIDFTVGDVPFKVIRGIKPNVFEIYKNGNLIDQDAASKDYQDKLEKEILQISYDTFCQIVVLGAANWKAFLSLSAAERRKVLEDMLNIEIFTVMNNLLKDRQGILKEKITTIEKDISVLNNSIEMQEKHEKELKRQSDDLIASKKAKIVEYQTKIASLETKKNDLQDKIDDIDLQLVKMPDIKSKIDELSGKLNKIDIHDARMADDIAFYNENTSCPTCKQNIDEDFRALMLSEEKKKINKSKSIRDKLVLMLTDAKNALVELQELTEKKAKLNSDVQTCNMNIAALQSGVQNALEDMQNVGNINKQRDVRDYKSELNVVLKRKTELIENGKVFALAAGLLKDDGIKSQIIRQYIPIINTLVNRYLERMEFYVKFHLNEKFDMEIKSLSKEDMSYENFSQGEKMRIDLALLFAWRDIIRQKKVTYCNLLILDEIMDSALDVQGTDNFIDIIRQLTKDNNVIIISHRVDQISDKFDNIIEVEKRKNFSKIKRS